MKKMRKIIPALAMLLVSAVMMSTASFAWFSINDSVTATGMQIKATTSGGLAIGSYTTETTPPSSVQYYTNATIAWSNHLATKGTGEDATTTYNGLLQPVSLNNGTWTKGTSAAADSHNNGAKYAAVTTTEQNSYYLLSKWNVKSLDDATDTTPTGLDVDAIAVANSGTDPANANLLKAVRVAMKVTTGGTAAWYYFAPGYDAGTTGLKYATYTEGEAASVTTYGGSNNKITCGTSNLGVQISNQLKKSTPVTVEVYVYFEGEDEHCTSVNAVNAANYTVTLTFKAATPQA